VTYREGWAKEGRAGVNTLLSSSLPEGELAVEGEKKGGGPLSKSQKNTALLQNTHKKNPKTIYSGLGRVRTQKTKDSGIKKENQKTALNPKRERTIKIRRIPSDR